MNKLHVLKSDTAEISFSDPLKPKTFRELTKARFDREWKNHPEQFNPLKNARERTRVARTINFIKRHLTLKGSTIADLASGSGHLSKMYRDEGGIVDAVDIAQSALNALKDEKDIRTALSCVPNTHLEDGAYDLVACTELIGHLSPREHRLLFNELARLSKSNGFILFSTSIDIHSEDALDKLFYLMQTELEMIDFQPSYHSRQIRLERFFSMPRKFFLASQNSKIREKELSERYSIWHYWFKWNSSKYLGILWKGIAPISDWIKQPIDQSQWLLLFLEKLWHSEASISHIIVLARRKKLVLDQALIPNASDQ